MSIIFEDGKFVEKTDNINEVVTKHSILTAYDANDPELNDPKYNIYVYYTFQNNKLFFKLGKADNNISARYKTATGNNAGSHMILVWSYHPSNIKAADKPIHEKLTEELDINNGLGFKKASNEELNTNEAYEIENLDGIKNFINIVNNFVNSTPIKNETFVLRENQKECCERFFNWYNSPNKTTPKFLLGALCRFGKTLVVLHILKALGFKHILILSGMCDTQEAWSTNHHTFSSYIDENNTEVEYAKYEWIEKSNLLEDKNVLDNHKNNNVICWFSLQSSAKDYEDIDMIDAKSNVNDLETYQKNITEFSWDIVIFDECHFGVETDRTKKFMKAIYKNCEDAIELNISATPFTKLESGEYNELNSFIYSFNEEYEDHCNGKLNEFVPLNLNYLNLLDFINNNGLKEINEKGAYKKTAGRTISGTSITEQKIKKFQNYFKGLGLESKYNWDAIIQDFSADDLGFLFKKLILQNFDKHGKNHMYVVKTIEQGKKLAEILKNIFGDERHIYNCCGENKPRLKQINNNMKAAIKENKKPVICISCGRYLTGTTMKYLQVVSFFCKIQSAERFIQFACRAKNWWNGRETGCNVFDLNPESFIQTDGFRNLIRAYAKYHKKTYKDIIKEFEESINIFEFACDPNYCLFNKKENIAEEISNKFYNIDDGSLIYDLDIDDIKNISAELVNISNKKISTANIIEIGTNGFENAKHTNRNKSDSCNDPAKEKTINKNALLNALEQIKTGINYIPGFMKYHNITEVETLFSQNFVKNCGKRTYSDLFKYWYNKFDLENLKIIKNYFIKNDQQYKWDNIVTAIQYAIK